MFDFKLQPSQVSKAALLTGAALVLSAVSSAQAQNVRYTSGQLEQVQSHTTPLKLQIVDSRPTVTDVRRRPAPVTGYNVVIPAIPGGGSDGGTNTLVPTNSGLPQSAFESQISADGMSVNRNLPGVEQSHLGKQMAAEAKAAKAVSARPIGQPGAKPTAAAKAAPVSASTYPTMYKSGGQAGSTVSTTSKVVGVVTRKDLLGR